MNECHHCCQPRANWDTAPSSCKLVQNLKTTSNYNLNHHKP